MEIQEAIQKLGLKWYTDPGHGWLRVPVQAIHEAGVAMQISSCSYVGRGGSMAYLEEDCDAPLFLEAIGVSYVDGPTIPVQRTDSNSFIRGLRHWNE